MRDTGGEGLEVDPRDDEEFVKEIGSSALRRSRVHILKDGQEVGSDAKDPAKVVGKRAFGDASRATLHLSSKLGADDAQTEFFTSPDLRSCHLLGNADEGRFMGGVFRRVCIPEAEMLLSQQPVLELAEDLEVSAARSMLLARALKWHSGYFEMDLHEKIEKLEGAVDLEKSARSEALKENRELKKWIEGLEAKIVKDKETVKKEREEAQGIINRNIELRGQVKTKEDELAKSEDARETAEGRASASAARVLELGYIWPNRL